MKAKDVLRIIGILILLVFVVACIFGAMSFFDSDQNDIDSVYDDVNGDTNTTGDNQDESNDSNSSIEQVELSVFVNNQVFDSEGSYSISKDEDLLIEVRNNKALYTDYSVSVLHNPNVTDFVYIADKSEFSFKQEDFKKYITTEVKEGVITLSCDYSFNEVMLDKYPALTECYVKDFSTVDVYEGIFVLRIQVNNSDTYFDIPFNFDGWIGVILSLSDEVIYI